MKNITAYGYIIVHTQTGNVQTQTFASNRSRSWEAFLGAKKSEVREAWKFRGFKCVFVTMTGRFE